MNIAAQLGQAPFFVAAAVALVVAGATFFPSRQRLEGRWQQSLAGRHKYYFTYSFEFALQYRLESVLRRWGYLWPGTPQAVICQLRWGLLALLLFLLFCVTGLNVLLSYVWCLACGRFSKGSDCENLLGLFHVVPRFFEPSTTSWCLDCIVRGLRVQFNHLRHAEVAKDEAGFMEQLGVFAAALVVAVPVISGFV